MSAWQPIETAPIGAWGLFMGALWRHPYWGVRNGDGGRVWIDGIGGEPSGWQAFDATHWMPIEVPQAHDAVARTAPSQHEPSTRDKGLS